VDDNGGYCGKTFLQNKIKEAKSEDKIDTTWEEYADKIIKQLMYVPEGMDGKLIWDKVLSFLK